MVALGNFVASHLGSLFPAQECSWRAFLEQGGICTLSKKGDGQEGSSTEAGEYSTVFVLQDTLRPGPEKSPYDLFLALGISLEFKKKNADEEQCLYIFDPLLNSREMIAPGGELDAALCLALKTKLCFLGWMCSWVGTNAFYSFLALWHVHFFFFFCILPQLSKPWLVNNPLLEFLLIAHASSFLLERIFFQLV